jgi:hypothetical protein
MKSKFSLLLFLLTILVSCKDDKATTTDKDASANEVAVVAKNEIKLSNYSDENWKNGVGTTFKMFLADNNPTNLELIKNGKELELADGTKVPYIGCEEKGGFIQIYITESTQKFIAAAEYPNVLKVN